MFLKRKKINKQSQEKGCNKRLEDHPPGLSVDLN